MQTILIVEDDRLITRALDIRLSAHGHAIRCESDAIGAMDAALADAPDVVVLDINLPGGSGLMLAERLLADPSTTDVPVIFITASRQPRLRERAAELSAVAFLEKPFAAAALLDAIDAARCRRDALQP